MSTGSGQVVGVQSNKSLCTHGTSRIYTRYIYLYLYLYIYLRTYEYCQCGCSIRRTAVTRREYNFCSFSSLFGGTKAFGVSSIGGCLSSDMSLFASFCVTSLFVFRVVIAQASKKLSPRLFSRLDSVAGTRVFSYPVLCGLLKNGLVWVVFWKFFSCNCCAYWRKKNDVFFLRKRAEKRSSIAFSLVKQRQYRLWFWCLFSSAFCVCFFWASCIFIPLVAWTFFFFYSFL